jgi:serine/threonine-protein kinase
MPLGPGSRIGPYEITALLGEGGMGKVWRARHSGLKRDDALKVLPDEFAADPERLARFQREAQVLASLNHANIAHVYGLEQGDGVQALVMELVDGPTLADRIRQGPIPIDEALPIAKQIAEALEAAHEQGIIHRDLKPANIKLRPDGTVKVLDFGLAKAVEPAGTSPSATQSPTMTSPTMMTGVGVLLGTAAYMSPEQAKGRAADKRSDIWAFGCVLYEMLTGSRAFEGDDVGDTLANVLKVAPDWDAVPGAVPQAIRVLLRRCLEKDRNKRVGDVAAALFVIREQDALSAAEGSQNPAYVLKEAAATQAEAAVSGVRIELAQSARRRVALVGVAGVVATALSAGLVWVATRPTTTPPQVERFTIAQAGTTEFSGGFSITPDGTRVVYVGNNATQLFVRAFDQLDPTVIATGSLLGQVFVAPDGQWIGFVETSTSLKRVAIAGGPAVTMAVTDDGAAGAAWMPDDNIIFATIAPATGLQRVAAAGGDVTVLTRPDRARGEADHLFPQILPGGLAVLFTITAATGGLDAAQVAVLDLRTGTSKVLLRGGNSARYVPTGHLVYAAGGTLRAVGFDLASLETRGTSVPVLPRLIVTPVGSGAFALAANGTLVYADAPGAGSLETHTLVWVNRQGQEQPIEAPPRAYLYPRISPDGTRVALHIADQEQDLWLWDLARQTLTRLTFGPSIDQFPVWTPDGRRLLFSSQRAGAFNVYWQAADGTGAAERLTEGKYGQHPTSVSPDGSRVVFQEGTQTMGRDLMLLALDGVRGVAPPSPGLGAPRPLLQTPFEERNGVISPDGRWLAYESDSSGRFEIYVRPFPNVSDGQWLISTAGGTRPRWARNGRELFYLAPDGALTAVRVDARDTTWSAGRPAKILEGRYFSGGARLGTTYDISPDGQRFLMIKQADSGQTAPPPQIVVVKNWFEELKRLVPAN